MSWFSNLFGFKESTGGSAALAETKKKFEYDGSTGRLTSLPNGRVFEAGTFDTPTLAELRAEVDLNEARKMFPGKVVFTEEVADVSHVHMDPDNKFALFQAASQFNCLEFPSERGRPEDGITCYTNDHTQGPACAIACAAGTIVRNYFGMKGECQTQLKQVECLKGSEIVLDNGRQGYFTVGAGYTKSNNHKLERLNKKLADEPDIREQFKDSMRIGFQWQTEVTGGEFGRVQLSGTPHLVSQAYCSACSISYSGGDKDMWRPLATMVLESLYEATMYGAVKNALRHGGAEGSRKVFLTAVGGGVFGNEIPWISQAMRKAFEKVSDIDLQVIFVSYGRPSTGFADLLADYPTAPQPAPVATGLPEDPSPNDVAANVPKAQPVTDPSETEPTAGMGSEVATDDLP